jgi:alpha-galactosidase
MYPYGIVEVCPDHVVGCQPGQYISREKWGQVGSSRAAGMLQMAA